MLEYEIKTIYGTLHDSHPLTSFPQARLVPKYNPRQMVWNFRHNRDLGSYGTLHNFYPLTFATALFSVKTKLTNK
jgi:hypothetical protein